LGNNILGYEALIKIEIILREYIILHFDSIYSTENWLKRNGPLGDDKDPYCDGCKKNSKGVSLPQKIEAQRKYYIDKGWDSSSAITTHGLYFLLLTDLPDFFRWDIKGKYKLNGETVRIFKNLNQNQIDLLCGHITSIYPIRNKIAHSCLISNFELITLQSVEVFCKGFFENYEELLNKPENRNEEISELKNHIAVLTKKMIKMEGDIYDELGKFENLSKKYLNSQNDFMKFKDILDKYSSLNRQNGTYPKIKELINSNKDFLNNFI
jgi:hypothetical protein